MSVSTLLCSVTVGVTVVADIDVEASRGWTPLCQCAVGLAHSVVASEV
jgi:hypothetical protein